jgi:hypothetical protein
MEIQQKLRWPIRRAARKALIAASCCALLFVAIGWAVIRNLVSDTVPGNGPGGTQAPPDSVTQTSTTVLPLPAVDPTGQPGQDSSATKQTMADCEAEAAKDPDGLYFLVTPVAPATLEAAASLLPLGEDYRSFALIQSETLLAGLENGSLALATTPYKFSVIDVKWSYTQTWNEAKGPSKFIHPSAAAVSNFRIGFAFGDRSVRWTNVYDRRKGTCYWVNVRLPGQLFASHPGRLNFGRPKKLP